MIINFYVFKLDCNYILSVKAQNYSKTTIHAVHLSSEILPFNNTISISLRLSVKSPYQDTSRQKP